MHTDSSPAAGAIELRGVPYGLFDEPIILRARGAGPGETLRWRARYRDDDGRTWRAVAASAEDLGVAWRPAKGATGTLAALQSLRPVAVDVRVDAPDGRAATRTLKRRLIGDGVEIRRWRDGLSATLYLPAAETPCATVLVDATPGATQATVATLAAPLLASRGALVLVVAPARGNARTAGMLGGARERLVEVPAASEEVLNLAVMDPFAVEAEPGPAVVLPPGVGAHGGAAAVRASAWDRLLHHLGADPRAAIGRD